MGRTWSELQSNVFLSRSGVPRFSVGAAAIVLLGAAVTYVSSPGVAQQSPKSPPPRSSGFQLFSSPVSFLGANRLNCRVDNQGNVCYEGLWPEIDQFNRYTFRSGLQIAGINSDGAGPWSADTVGAYFYDSRGTQQHSQPLSDLFDSTRPGDLDSWPPEALLSDPDLYPVSKLGTPALSEQDTWTQYWDGDPNRIANREHPMGVRISQRSLAWNVPLGHESIIYFVFEIENVTDEPAFQEASELGFFGGSDALPNEGWRVDSIYVALANDFDVTVNATQNFSTAILPFEMGLSYHGGFVGSGMRFDPTIFKPPFFTASPGIIGTKFLRTPVDPITGRAVGLTHFAITQNPSSTGAQFTDPLGVVQLWRYLSGRVVSGLDPDCNVLPTTPSERPVCFVSQQAGDTRFFQSTGPFSLEAGESTTIAIAFIVAATVETLPDGSPSGILVSSTDPNANPPGFPSVHPGFSSRRGCDANGQNCTEIQSAAQNAVKPIERGAGWYRYSGPAPAGDLETNANKLDPFRVEVVPESLLGKALIAQTIFDNKFELSKPPDPPPFFLVPSDDRVVIVWERSPSETTGDPFFDVVSDPQSVLFNPNFRRLDVEGYVIWRGTRPDQLEQIAQFDYAGTTFTDYTCETVMPFEDVGVIIDVGGAPTPVEGYIVGEDCPLGVTPLVRDLGPANAAASGQTFSLTFNNGGAGGPPGGGMARIRANPVAVQLDTVRPPGSTLGLQNNGVPFAFADEEVTNNFTYYYAVTAFDVNSEATGPNSLASALQVKSTAPRAFASNLSVAFEAVAAVTGDDGVPLETEPGFFPLENVQPDSATGVFPGPQPPTNSVDFVLTPPPELLAELLGSDGLVGRIDSVVPRSGFANACPNGMNALDACWEIHMTFDDGRTVEQTVSHGFTPVWDSFGERDFSRFPLGAGILAWDDDALQRFGVPAGFGAGIAARVDGHFGMTINYSSFEGQANRRSIISGSVPGGSRWFDGDTETLPNPTLFIGAGQLTGIDTVWKPVHHTPIDVTGARYPASGEMQCFGYSLAPLSRAADVRVTWNGGTIQRARDVTHNVNVPFNRNPRASFGFLTVDANRNGSLDWQDFDYLEFLNVHTPGLGFCTLASPPSPIRLRRNPTIMPTSTQGNAPGAMAATGQGFALYINAERYIFETSGTPPDGTVWTLRTYTGVMSANGTNDAPTDYVLTGGDSSQGWNRPPLITGLEFRLDITQAGVVSSGKPDLAAIHTVPDPYLGSSRFDLAPTERQLMFVNMPAQCTLRIYSLNGVLIRSFNYRDQSGGGRMAWDMRSRSGASIASGVYFFQVTTLEGDEHVGKFTVVTGSGSF